MMDIVERLRGYYVMHGGEPMFRSDTKVHRAIDLHEAADVIAILRKEVEDAKADAALAREGYKTAYAEFDSKCRTVNRLVFERNILRRLLVKYGDRVRMATSNDDQQIIDDAFAAHQGAGE